MAYLYLYTCPHDWRKNAHVHAEPVPVLSVERGDKLHSSLQLMLAVMLCCQLLMMLQSSADASSASLSLSLLVDRVIGLSLNPGNTTENHYCNDFRAIAISPILSKSF